MSSEPMKIFLGKPSNKTSNINCAVSSSIKHTIQTYPDKTVSLLLYLAAVDTLSCIDYKDIIIS